MRYLTTVVFAFLISCASPVRAGDPSEIFGTILGEIGRQIERKQQEKQLRRLQPLWTACANGDVSACDRAGDFPNLTEEARAQIAQMREAAEQRPAYERNFYACQKLDEAACEAALAYRYASAVDRTNLQRWRRAAYEQRQTLTRFRRHAQSCYAGSLADCDAALAQRQLDERAAQNIEAQRSRLILAEERRALRERRRQAEVREYIRLHDACAAGTRAACKKAAIHPQVPQSDLAFLNRRARELAPVIERVATFVSDVQTQDGGGNNSVSVGLIGLAVIGVFTLIGAAVGANRLLRQRLPHVEARPTDPPAFDPAPPIEPAVHFGEKLFPLTGHMPTDVRYVLQEAQP